MSLGEHVRISRKFLEFFKAPESYIPHGNNADIQELRRLQADLKVRCSSVFQQILDGMDHATITELSRPAIKTGHKRRQNTTATI